MYEEINPFQMIREFERFLFDGIPEHPEPTFGRDSFGQVDTRPTGRAHNDYIDYTSSDFVVVGKFTIDSKTGKEVFKEYHQKS